MREKLPLLATVLGVIVSVASALTMRDHVRIVDIFTLFFGGVATGAGVVRQIAAAKQARGPSRARE
jgi:hypothetical protein